jgi:hypothetical protein
MTSDSDLARYLLGEASEQEQLRLEEEFFSNDETYQELMALEDELRYEYAQGGLTARQRKHFEQRYLVTAADREKVALAKSVLARTFELAPLRERRKGWLAKLFAPGLPQLAYGSLALVAMAGGSLLLFQTIQLKGRLSQLEAERARDARQYRAQEDQLKGQLAEQRNHNEQQAPAAFFSFVLAPGLTRDLTEATRIVVPGNANAVRLQLDAKGLSTYKRYRVELQTLEGAQVWGEDVSAATITVPVRLLVPGDYDVTMRGITAAGEAEPTTDFYFTVVRK